MRKVRVELGEMSYDIVIGRNLKQELQAFIEQAGFSEKALLISDTNVGRLYGGQVLEVLRKAGLKAELFMVPAGESSKSLVQAEALYTRAIELGLDRRSAIFALGGGVVGDLAGFAAASLRRGVRFVQAPTSLLAQVDSSVGGKTGINSPLGKNLIGAFHQPRLVLADLDVLTTLPDREMRAGYAEIIKYGLLGDFAFFEWLETNGPAVLAREPDALAYAVARSIEMKAEIVVEDEKEAGRRALLNLGHTFGHALEAETGYGEALLHGEAVAAGSAIAFRFSAAQGLCDSQDAQRAEAAIAAVGLPTRLTAVSSGRFGADQLVRHMGQDKKAEGGKLTFILARALGGAFVAKDVSAQAVRDFLVSEGALP